MRWGRRRRYPSARGRPPRRPPPRRRPHSLWRLPRLGAPKSRRPLGWRNCGRQYVASTVGKNVCVPTQHYDARSRKVRKRFLGILSVELYGVRDRKCNAERLIVFQSVVLLRSQGGNNSAQICKHILFLLDCCNRGAFDELVKDTYNSAVGYLRKSCGNETEEQRHRTFSNLVLKVRLRKAVWFVSYR